MIRADTQNFHRVLLGTFHAKFLIVDRKVALINSNNIQGQSSPFSS
jgi:phosphatidylserine/phosphatidylglycerophosphate/cardiolipin synthase-like enzyme